MNNAARLQELERLYNKKREIFEQLTALHIKNTAKNFRPYEYQLEFIAAGQNYNDRRLMAANQIGKTRGSAFEFYCHLTGKYPDWWPGFKFAHPITAWGLGVSNEQIRDVLQKHLCGVLEPGAKTFTADETVPPFLNDEDIISVSRNAQSAGLAKDVYVRHVSGRKSLLSFKGYEQGQAKIMGSVVDYAQIDEEPQDKKILPQVLTRLINGNRGKGGKLVVTFTPEYGMTEQVSMLLKDRPPQIYLQRATWDDAPHLTEERKAQILASYPSYQRDMRSKGVPVRGQGRIFEVSRDDIMYKRSMFPNDRFPQHFRHLLGHDFGWDHPQAWAWLAIDPDTDTIYVYRVMRAKNKRPEEVAGLFNRKEINALWIPVAWPADGHQTEKSSGLVLAQQYAEYGFNMLEEHATHEPEWAKANNASLTSLYAGVAEMQNRFNAGTLRIKEGLEEAFEEVENYYQEDGKIVAIDDDILSAIRYGMMMKRFAIMKPIARQEQARMMRRANKASTW